MVIKRYLPIIWHEFKTQFDDVKVSCRFNRSSVQTINPAVFVLRLCRVGIINVLLAIMALMFKDLVTRIWRLPTSGSLNC